MRKYFQSPQSVYCKVNVPAPLSFAVDGYSYHKMYDGWYFKGEKISVSIDSTKPLAYWKINGMKIEAKGNSLSFAVQGKTFIEPVFKHPAAGVL